MNEQATAQKDNIAETTVADESQVKPPAKSMNDLVGIKGQNIQTLQINQVLEGQILSKGKNEVYLDLPSYGIGVVRGRELYDDSRILSKMKVGDNVYALVVDPENKNGIVELSFRAAGHERVWTTLNELLESKEVVTSKVIEANKGGLMLEINNVIGFLPVSQLSTEHYPRVEAADKNKILSHLKSYVGQDFKVRVITADSDNEKLIVSEKAAQAEELGKKLAVLKMGEIVEGTITGIVDFGAFIKFGEELEGLIHISELAWQRIDNPKDIVKVGDKVKAQVINTDKGRISLSMKRLSKDPWEEVVSKYQVGQTIKGTVTKLMPFGAFVELDDDIHGLAHLGELSSDKSVDPKTAVTEGKEYEFKIISIEPDHHRLGLSRKALELETKKGDPKKSEEESKKIEKKGEEKEEPKKIEEKTKEKQNL